MNVQKHQLKVAVSVSEMARMVGLSRARFYQLMDEGRFPKPSYDSNSGRPYFDTDQQGICLDVRHRNCGIDGNPVLFYARRNEIRPSPVPRHYSPPVVKPQTENAELLDGLKSLGLTSITSAQLKSALADLFPKGISGIDQGEVIRTVFITIMRRNSADNVRR